jgi:hypothetical protein
MGMTNQAMLSLVGDEADAFHGARARLRLLLAAKLVTTTGEIAVKLRELSPTAAVVTGDRFPSVGTDIILKRGHLEALATIVWTDGTRARLEFEDPLNESDLLAQMSHTGTTAPMPLPRSFS